MRFIKEQPGVGIYLITCVVAQHIHAGRLHYARNAYMYCTYSTVLVLYLSISYQIIMLHTKSNKSQNNCTYCTIIYKDMGLRSD